MGTTETVMVVPTVSAVHPDHNLQIGVPIEVDADLADELIAAEMAEEHDGVQTPEELEVALEEVGAERDEHAKALDLANAEIKSLTEERDRADTRIDELQDELDALKAAATETADRPGPAAPKPGKGAQTATPKKGTQTATPKPAKTSMTGDVAGSNDEGTPSS